MLLALCAALGWPQLSPAQTATEFFGQKTIKFVITYEPGGSYDLYARLVTMHLPKHLAGHPAMVMQYMPGAGGLLGTLHFHDKAAQDGSELAILPRDIAINQMLRHDTARYDARRFNWIGTLSSYIGVMFVASRTGVKSADDLRRIDAQNVGKDLANALLKIVDHRMSRVGQTRVSRQLRTRQFRSTARTIRATRRSRLSGPGAIGSFRRRLRRFSRTNAGRTDRARAHSLALG